MRKGTSTRRLGKREDDVDAGSYELLEMALLRSAGVSQNTAYLRMTLCYPSHLIILLQTLRVCSDEI